MRRLSGRSRVFSNIKRILVFRIGQLGDTIVSLPAMWAVRKYFPDAQMALLSDVHGNDEYVRAQSIFPPDGLFEQWLTYPAKYGGTSSRGMVKLLMELRRNNFDILVYLAPRWRTSGQVRRDLFFFYLAGIHTFIGHRGFEELPPKVPGEPLPALQHETDHLLFRLSLDGIPVPEIGSGEMDLKLTNSEREAAHGWMVNYCGSDINERMLIGIGPGSKKPSKVWPVEYYVELGKKLMGGFNLFPVVFGGQEDMAFADYLIRQWGKGACAAGRLTVRQAAALLSQCRLFIGNDTGTMHLAAAVGTPCVVAFSAQYYPGAWHPYGKGHAVLREDVPCEGCMLNECNRDLICLRGISVGKMMEASKNILEKFDDINNFVVSDSGNNSIFSSLSGGNL